MNARSREIALLVVAPVGALLLALAAMHHPPVFRFVVREDSVLEWAQVLAFAGVVIGGAVSAPRAWAVGDRAAAAVLTLLAVAAFVSVGEELSWGQRVFGFGTPELFAENQQGEVTVHNDARVATASRAATLCAGLYGMVAPFVVRGRSAFAPPRTTVSLFAVVAAYFGYRLLFLSDPDYVAAKYSEWPELCLAVGAACWCVALMRRAARSRAPSHA